jgi:hypothetical protein
VFGKESEVKMAKPPAWKADFVARLQQFAGSNSKPQVTHSAPNNAQLKRPPIHNWW